MATSDTQLSLPSKRMLKSADYNKPLRPSKDIKPNLSSSLIWEKMA